MADTISQERSFAPPKKGVEGVPCAIKSQDPYHYMTSYIYPCNSLVTTSVWLDHGTISMTIVVVKGYPYVCL